MDPFTTTTHLAFNEPDEVLFDSETFHTMALELRDRFAALETREAAMTQREEALNVRETALEARERAITAHERGVDSVVSPREFTNWMRSMDVSSPVEHLSAFSTTPTMTTPPAFTSIRHVSDARLEAGVLPLRLGADFDAAAPQPVPHRQSEEAAVDNPGKILVFLKDG